MMLKSIFYPKYKGTMGTIEPIILLAYNGD